MPVRICIWFCLAGLLFAAGSDAGVGQTGQIEAVSQSPQQPRSGEVVKIVARAPDGATQVKLQYQLVDPGSYLELKDAAYKTNWISIPMKADGSVNGTDAGYVAELPAGLQTHRRLVRYRISATDASGETVMAPSPEDPQPNFAYFVYDGIPGWSGAIEPKSSDPKRGQPVQYSPSVMRSVQAYHFIGKANSVENATWREQPGGKEYKYTGTLVSDGKVYDHIRFRARGGVWRYAMGKNMWKFDFTKGHPLEARDDYGRPYRVKWGKLNLRACIQQGDYGHRGEQGMFESVGFRLFSLAGVPAPHTHWIQLRIIDEAKESPASQYKGDFWGLYLAIENEDGHFLEEHGLPDGNLYKMEGGTGTLGNHGNGAVTNRSDLDKFMFTYEGGNPPVTWWRTNLNLPAYYSYRSILECIHHYDVEQGKNYDYYLNPRNSQWTVIPWDIDLTWADNMYGGGNEPFKRHVLSHPAFRIEYQNRLREIRDLLFNPVEAGALIDECAAIIADPSGGPSMVDADRAKWDYHPVMAMGGKAGQGLFYEAAPNRDFRGMVRLMKMYVKTRSAWIDARLVNDPKIPATPSLAYTGPTNFPANHLTFHCTDFSGTGPFAAMKWRVGEIRPPNASNTKPARTPREAPAPYEITPVWESAESEMFQPELTIPADKLQAGHNYCARVRMKDRTGRWSHWSPAVQFAASPAVP